MKKLLLLLCAFMASISGAWAQVPVNLALAGTATASLDNEHAYLSNDGNSETRWGSNGGTNTEWYQVAWESAQTFNTVKILCENAMNLVIAPELAFDIQVSDDGVIWTTKKHVWGKNAGNNEYITVVFNTPATAQYVRFQGVKQGTYGYSFFEFEVYNIDYTGKELNSLILSTYKDKVSAFAGKTIALSVIGKTSDDEEIPAGELTWSNTSPTIGTITDETFNALAEGTTTIGVSANSNSISSETKEFTVAAAQTLGSFTLPYYVFSALNGYNIDAEIKDQFGEDFLDEVTLSWEGAAPVGAVITGKNIVFGAASGAGTYTLKATDGVNTITRQLYFVGAAPAAPTGDDVSVVYDGTTGEWSNQGWGWGSTQRDLIIGTKTCRLGENLGGMQIPNTQTDYTTYKKVVVDVWSAQAHSLIVLYEGGNATKNLEVVAGWNQLEVPTSIVSNPANVSYLTFQYKDSDPKDGSLVFSNVYYSKEEPADPAIVVTVDGVTTVTGKVTESDISTISASTASKLDLTGVSSWTATSPISSANPNQIIVVGCTYTGTNNNPGTITPNINVANTKNVVAFTDYYFALTPIEITDNNTYQPWIGSINTNYGNNGYTITRTVAADKYVSAYFPTTTTNVTVTNGTIYRIDAVNSTTSEVKFNKAVSVGGGTPFIVHTTGEATITATGSGDLNMGENGGNTAQIEFASSAALFKGNLIVKQGTGAEWGLQSSTNPEFMQIGTGAKIGAFRAYFTGLTAAGTGARAFFIDDNGTTSIKKIEEILNHEDVYYNLNGQRVQNPTKGIYILNGKKVIIK